MKITRVPARSGAVIVHPPGCDCLEVERASVAALIEEIRSVSKAAPTYVPCGGCGGTGVWTGWRACLTCDGDGAIAVAQSVMDRGIGR